MASNKLPLSFYQQSNVVQLSKKLIGKVLCTQINGKLTSGLITETEAYRGYDDKASHASGGKRTQRTETMFKNGGISYVYLCYGIHHLFNVVTNTANKPDAVLIRAIKPLQGKETMLQRRNASANSPSLTAGPGRLSQALGITTANDALPLTGSTLWIEDRGDTFSDDMITAKPRIGVDYAGDHASRPWRFFIHDSAWVSHK
ncbi:DNA-3-methyladenine glycosylase [Fodinibius salsisoli]|uniref:Putative 3-methyladenine DNA glycosylase n=1 Tax=Fodinibius salsisoli TaxID=2820877 RepID=A0ABT3PP28_9BACT|nr:DNA-3-methyladenine glycosylase [Fodinibius salsisoli]MCW9707612.1 DNA-3-methyladenine glycosylase [Fodinibius salsisoli]